MRVTDAFAAVVVICAIGYIVLLLATFTRRKR
jgi:hypothetical protein